ELNSLSSTVFSLIKDHIIDSTDIVVLSRKKSLSLTDTLWHANILDDRYFSTSADSLTTEEKKQVETSYQNLIQKENEQFCTALVQLIKNAQISVDSVQIPEGKLNTVIRGIPCTIK
ncbi:MAG: hypothetical protein CUN57_03350, partial [Phototrophicales bacterium]